MVSELHRLLSKRQSQSTCVVCPEVPPCTCNFGQVCVEVSRFVVISLLLPGYRALIFASPGAAIPVVTMNVSHHLLQPLPLSPYLPVSALEPWQER